MQVSFTKLDDFVKIYRFTNITPKISISKSIVNLNNDKAIIMELDNPVISAIKKDSEFESALNSPSNVIFMLKADIMTLKTVIDKKQD